MTFTIMITTRNRRDELRRTLAKLRELTPGAEEVLICADGCTDDTASMMRSDFSNCILFENETSRGSVFSRDRMLRAARGEIVVSLDDDSYPMESDFLVRVQDLFAQNSRAAVISFPEIRDGGESASATKTPSSPAHLVSAYPNCAAAMRPEVYFRSAGFPQFFGHMYEEPDYALQCYALGFVVIFEPSATIRHHVSPIQRRPMQRHQINARNELWSVWMRCPFPYLIGVSLFRMWRQLLSVCGEGVGWIIREPQWWLSALRGLSKCLRNRSPIPWNIYYAWMRLAKNPVNSAEDWYGSAGLPISTGIELSE